MSLAMNNSAHACGTAKTCDEPADDRDTQHVPHIARNYFAGLSVDSSPELQRLILQLNEINAPKVLMQLVILVCCSIGVDLSEDIDCAEYFAGCMAVKCLIGGPWGSLGILELLEQKGPWGLLGAHRGS